MQDYNYNKEKSYFSIIKDKFEGFEKVKKLRAYQKHHSWTKFRYLAIAYVAWWGLKIGAIAYSSTLINNIQTKFSKDTKKEKLEQTINSAKNNFFKSSYFILEQDTTIKEKIKKYKSLERLIE